MIIYRAFLTSKILVIACRLGSDPKIGVCEGACSQTVSLYILDS